MSKHTPGPWSAELGEAYNVRAPHGGIAAQVLHLKGRHGVGGRVPGEEAAANARLIAAAPTMFEEIEREYTELADIRNNWKGRHTLEGQQKLCRLRDLICLVTGRDHVDVQDDYSTRLINAKATGEQP